MTPARLILPLLALLGLAACESQPPVAGPVETGAGAVETSTLDPNAASTAAAATDAAPDTHQRYTLDGLVGQVNGKPVYARNVLEPMDEQLTQIARQFDGHAFQGKLIGVPGQPGVLTQRMNEIVLNALMLGEAERDLTDEQQQGLAHYLEEYRAELLRKYGRGSVAVAEQAMREERGMSLDQAIDEYRSGILVRRYRDEKIMPNVNVTRRDIERYYRDHPEKYNPPAKRVVRLIKVTNPADAQAVADALSSPDTSFAELAAGEFNVFSRNAGLMDLDGEPAFAVPALNDSLKTMKTGEHAGPFESDDGSFWFVYLESIDQPPTYALMDVQVQIEDELRNQQFNILRARFVQQILANGSYTPIEDMVARLYAIVEARYKAAPQTP